MIAQKTQICAIFLAAGNHRILNLNDKSEEIPESNNTLSVPNITLFFNVFYYFICSNISNKYEILKQHIVLLLKTQENSLHKK